MNKYVPSWAASLDTIPSNDESTANTSPRYVLCSVVHIIISRIVRLRWGLSCPASILWRHVHVIAWDSMVAL